MANNDGCSDIVLRGVPVDRPCEHDTHIKLAAAGQLDASSWPNLRTQQAGRSALCDVQQDGWEFRHRLFAPRRGNDLYEVLNDTRTADEFCILSPP
jgi:hypothetical protein